MFNSRKPLPIFDAIRETFFIERLLQVNYRYNHSRTIHDSDHRIVDVQNLDRWLRHPQNRQILVTHRNFTFASYSYFIKQSSYTQRFKYWLTDARAEG